MHKYQLQEAIIWQLLPSLPQQKCTKIETLSHPPPPSYNQTKPQQINDINKIYKTSWQNWSIKLKLHTYKRTIISHHRVSIQSKKWVTELFQERKSTGWNVIERNSGTVEGLLNGGRDFIGVAIGGDGNRPTVVHFHQCWTYILRYSVCVETLGYVTVLYVPPHRRLRHRVLTFCPSYYHLRRRRSSISGHSVSR